MLNAPEAGSIIAASTKHPEGGVSIFPKDNVWRGEHTFVSKIPLVAAAERERSGQALSAQRILRQSKCALGQGEAGKAEEGSSVKKA